ncbi:hypothetical protein HD554DRAFT_2167569 [Boletus coccyginus]|nr:hypothetical protein HD554DRAFT_2167569 [Boletus coccyginus]
MAMQIPMPIAIPIRPHAYGYTYGYAYLYLIAIVLAAQGKQRTKAEKEANNNHAALEKAAAEKVKEERIISIAKLIMQLHEEQNTATPESGASSARGLNSKPSASRAADQGQAQNTTVSNGTDLIVPSFIMS